MTRDLREEAQMQTRTIKGPLGVIRTFVELSNAPGLSHMRNLLELRTCPIVEVEGRRQSRMSNIYPRGGDFRFSQGSLELFCEVLPPSVDEVGIRHGQLPGGTRSPKDFKVFGLAKTRLAIGRIHRISGSHGSTMDGRVEVVAERHLRLAMAKSLSTIGVSQRDIQEALMHIELRLAAA